MFWRGDTMFSASDLTSSSYLTFEQCTGFESSRSSLPSEISPCKESALFCTIDKLQRSSGSSSTISASTEMRYRGIKAFYCCAIGSLGINPSCCCYSSRCLLKTFLAFKIASFLFYISAIAYMMCGSTNRAYSPWIG